VREGSNQDRREVGDGVAVAFDNLYKRYVILHLIQCLTERWEHVCQWWMANTCLPTSIDTPIAKGQGPLWVENLETSDVVAVLIRRVTTCKCDSSLERNAVLSWLTNPGDVMITFTDNVSLPSVTFYPSCPLNTRYVILSSLLVTQTSSASLIKDRRWSSLSLIRRSRQERILREMFGLKEDFLEGMGMIRNVFSSSFSLEQIDWLDERKKTTTTFRPWNLETYRPFFLW